MVSKLVFPRFGVPQEKKRGNARSGQFSKKTESWRKKNFFFQFSIPISVGATGARWQTTHLFSSLTTNKTKRNMIPILLISLYVVYRFFFREQERRQLTTGAKILLARSKICMRRWRKSVTTQRGEDTTQDPSPRPPSPPLFCYSSEEESDDESEDESGEVSDQEEEEVVSEEPEPELDSDKEVERILETETEDATTTPPEGGREGPPPSPLSPSSSPPPAPPPCTPSGREEDSGEEMEPYETKSKDD